MTTIDEKTKIPAAVLVSAVILVVPLTLWFGSIMFTANQAAADNVKQQSEIDILRKDISDIKADIREIKIILENKKAVR